MQHLLDPSSIAAYATVILAVFTAWMAAETRRLGREGQHAALWTDYQHQESLTPILKVAPDFPERMLRGDGEFYRFAHRVRNHGSGPALNVTVTFTPPNSNPVHWEIPPLGVNDEYEFRGEIATGLPKNDSRIINWTLAINYENLFGMAAQTMYRGEGLKVFFTRPYLRKRIERRESPLHKLQQLFVERRKSK